MLSAQELGIPRLDLSMRATGLVAPITKWGTLARSSPMPGTYHFYADDYKFSAIHKHPMKLVESGCAVAVEPNFSTWPDRPLAQVLADICRKRTLGLLWQSAGVKLLVDLNVSPEFREVNLLGVPEGWSAYAVRAHENVDWSVIEADYRAAYQRAGCPILFCVFGGGKASRARCEAQGWIHIPEHRHVVAGREPAHGSG